MQRELIRKYNVQGPRYTSYPTVPYWDHATFSPTNWINTVQSTFNASNESEGISIYIHLPFCEQLCTFCACHKRITKQHSYEQPYIDTVLKEWNLYLAEFKKVSPEKPRLKELHLGGGTPTFFSPENLQFLLSELFETVELAAAIELSFEGHPNNTSYEHLQTLYNLGFRRVSFGVQDYDPEVQKAINRIQPFENVEQVTNWAREIGYTSVSHDLVFGLPFHNWEKMEQTIRRTLTLEPDRLAFYSYAHVPWIKGVGQRGFSEEDLPKGEEKRKLYENGKILLEQLGYEEIGMDHFSKPTDDLYKSMKDRKLHRNFMGYTSSKTSLMIGLGMSAISDSWYGFAQNEKNLEDYQKAVENNQIPVMKGHILNTEDLIIRQHVINIMCNLETKWENQDLILSESMLSQLQEMEKDGLLILSAEGLKITDKGRPFVRNVAMAFDQRMLRSTPQTQLFSSIL